MINLIKFHNLTIPTPNNLPRLVERPEDVLANIPGWALFTVPEYSSEADNRIRNIANGTLSSPRSNTQLVKGHFPTGRTSFEIFDDDQELGLSFFVTPESINPNEWTVFVCGTIRPNDTTGSESGRIIRPTQVTGDSDEVALHCAWNRTNGNPLIFTTTTTSPGNNPIRLSANFSSAPIVERTQPTLFMYTFSVDNGLAIRDGRNLVASAPDDRRPLSLLPQGENSYIQLQNTRGVYGFSGVINKDLSKPENAGFRTALEDFAIANYDIHLEE